MMFFSKPLKEKRGLPSAGGGNGLVGSLLIGWEKSGNGEGVRKECDVSSETRGQSPPTALTMDSQHRLCPLSLFLSLSLPLSLSLLLSLSLSLSSSCSLSCSLAVFLFFSFILSPSLCLSLFCLSVSLSHSLSLSLSLSLF